MSRYLSMATTGLRATETFIKASQKVNYALRCGLPDTLSHLGPLKLLRFDKKVPKEIRQQIQQAWQQSFESLAPEVQRRFLTDGFLIHLNDNVLGFWKNRFNAATASVVEGRLKVKLRPLEQQEHSLAKENGLFLKSLPPLSTKPTWEEILNRYINPDMNTFWSLSDFLPEKELRAIFRKAFWKTNGLKSFDKPLDGVVSWRYPQLLSKIHHPSPYFEPDCNSIEFLINNSTTKNVSTATWRRIFNHETSHKLSQMYPQIKKDVTQFIKQAELDTAETFKHCFYHSEVNSFYANLLKGHYDAMFSEGMAANLKRYLTDMEELTAETLSHLRGGGAMHGEKLFGPKGPLHPLAEHIREKYGFLIAAP